MKEFFEIWIHTYLLQPMYLDRVLLDWLWLPFDPMETCVAISTTHQQASSPSGLKHFILYRLFTKLSNLCILGEISKKICNLACNFYCTYIYMKPNMIFFTNISNRVYWIKSSINSCSRCTVNEKWEMTFTLVTYYQFLQFFRDHTSPKE